LEAKEVDARAVLDWLDPTVPDDRLIACALRLQSDHPACCVVLITSDLNLQAKAEAAGLPYIETPPSTESLQAKLTARIIGAPHKRSARVELRNVGAATAKDITYSLEPPDDVVGTRLTAGPWHEDALKPGQTAEPQILMLYHDPSVLRAEWTDALARALAVRLSMTTVDQLCDDCAISALARSQSADHHRPGLA